MGSRAMILGGVLAAGALTGCGGSSHNASSVITTAPATSTAPLAPIARRVLASNEVPRGFTSVGQPAVAESVQEWVQLEQPPIARVPTDTSRLKRFGLVAAAGLALSSVGGPGWSEVEQFRSAAGARAELAYGVRTFESDPSLQRFGLSGIPGAQGFGAPRSGGGVVIFADGNYYYLLVEEGSAPANRAGLIAAAQKLYHRVHG